MKLNFAPKKYRWIYTKHRNFWVWKDIANGNVPILEIRTRLIINTLKFRIVHLYICERFIERTDTVIKRANMFS